MKILALVLTTAVLGLIGVAVAGWASTTPSLRLAPPAPAPPTELARTVRVHDVPLRIEVARLRRSGRAVTLDLRVRSLTPSGGPRFWFGRAFSAHWRTYADGFTLTDPITGRTLRVRDDADGDCECSSTYNVSLAPGGQTVLSATFPAPSPLARTIDVVVPHFGAFRDVPLR